MKISQLLINEDIFISTINEQNINKIINRQDVKKISFINVDLINNFEKLKTIDFPIILTKENIKFYKKNKSNYIYVEIIKWLEQCHMFLNIKTNKSQMIITDLNPSNFYNNFDEIQKNPSYLFKNDPKEDYLGKIGYFITPSNNLQPKYFQYGMEIPLKSDNFYIFNENGYRNKEALM